MGNRKRKPENSSNPRSIFLASAPRKSHYGSALPPPRRMQNFFLACALLGGAIVVLQLIFGMAGAHDVPHETPHDLHGGHAEHPSEGLHLFSVRAVTAGLALFGAAGMGAMAVGIPGLLALPIAVVVGLAGMVGVAWALRAMLRLEDDGTVSIGGAVGTSGVVYLTIPGERSGAGKVHLTLQNRTVELPAVTPAEALPTGAAVLVVDVVDPDTVVVVPSPSLSEA